MTPTAAEVDGRALVAVIGAVILATMAVVLLVPTNDRHTVETTVTRCEFVADSTGPFVLIWGTVTNHDTEQRSYDVTAASFDGRFVVGGVHATAAAVRPGETRVWGASAPADPFHTLPAIPTCRVLAASAY